MEASSVTHVFDVSSYNRLRELGVGSYLRSATFHAGGCAWALHFYPCGYSSPSDHVCVTLELITEDAVVTASYDMRLVDDATGGRYTMLASDKAELDTRCVEGFANIWRVDEFMKISDLEASPFLRDDRLLIECSLRVINATLAPDVAQPMAATELTVPPSELSEDMGRLLNDGEGSDVTFDVVGESFTAHSVVLAVRTPAAFQAMLQRAPMDVGAGVTRVVIDDMKPAAFKALLHFIYTDCLPSQAMDDDCVEMARQLLAAAERFDMGRFKLVCEKMISESLDVETVAATLAVADRYNCAGLKNACIEFMISGRIMDAVARTEGYAALKRDHPYLLVEAFEKAGQLGKI